MKFSEIITPQDQCTVAIARASIAYHTAQWCHEIWYHLLGIQFIARQPEEVNS